MHKGQGRMKIKNSLYITIILFTIIPIVIFGIYMIQANSERVEEIMNENLQVVSEIQISEIRNFCKQRGENLEILCQMDITKDLINGKGDAYGRDKEYLDNILKTHVVNDKFSESMTIVGKDFEVVSCSADYYESYAVNLQNGERYFEDGQLYFSNILNPNTHGNEKEVVAAVKGIYQGGELIGYIVEEINLLFFDSLRMDGGLWEQGTFYLIDGKHRIITAGTGQGESRKEFVLGNSEREDYNRKWKEVDLDKEPQGKIEYEVDSQKYATYYSTVDCTDWIVMVSINMSSFSKTKEQFLNLLRCSIVVFVVLMVWMSYMVTHRITRPVDKVIATLRDIQTQQDYSLRIDVDRKDEIGELSKEINMLVEYIERESFYEKERRRKLKDMAERDSLTGVLNKQGIRIKIEKMLKSAQTEKKRTALVFVDVDDFKNFNTEYGHMVGDQVLQFVADTLGILQGTVGRVGGDEFVVGINSQKAIDTLEDSIKRVMERLNGQFFLENEQTIIPICCSIGAAVSGESAQSYEELIQLADEAMFTAKNNGKNYYHIV